MEYHRFVDNPKVQGWGYKHVSVARLDKDDGQWPMIATVQNVEIGNEKVPLILCHTCKSSQHSTALFVLDYRRSYFNKNLGVLKPGLTSDTVKELYSNVQAKLDNLMESMREREKSLLESKQDGSISCDGYLSSDDSENDLMDTLKAEDWSASLHTTMVAIFKDRVVCAGPGEMSVVAGDGKKMKLISSPRITKESTLAEEVLPGRKVVVISSLDPAAGVQSLLLKTGKTAKACAIATAASDYNLGDKLLVATVRNPDAASSSRISD